VVASSIVVRATTIRAATDQLKLIIHRRVVAAFINVQHKAAARCNIGSDARRAAVEASVVDAVGAVGAGRRRVVFRAVAGNRISGVTIQTNRHATVVCVGKRNRANRTWRDAVGPSLENTTLIAR